MPPSTQCLQNVLLAALTRAHRCIGGDDYAGMADARPEGVNRPDLLPTEQTPVIDVAGFLTPSEVRHLLHGLLGSMLPNL